MTRQQKQNKNSVSDADPESLQKLAFHLSAFKHEEELKKLTRGMTRKRARKFKRQHPLRAGDKTPQELAIEFFMSRPLDQPR